MDEPAKKSKYDMILKESSTYSVVLEQDAMARLTLI
jgi:hypothetical protein